MRVLISIPFVGGVGGLERNVASTIAALAEDHVDVCTARRIDGGFATEPSGTVIPYRRVVPYRRIPSPLARPLRWAHRKSLARTEPYDAYLHYFAGRYVGDQFPIRTRLLIPSGNDVASFASRFDCVLAQAPDNKRFIRGSVPSVVLPPPVVATAESRAPDRDLPEQFVLTVFNAYHGIKGGELMRDVASASRFPIVWCFSRRTRHYDIAPYAHHDIVTIEDASPANLRWLYEHAAAYVSFSRTEGFGWAIADALQYGTPVISRRTGVLSLDGIDLRGVSVYEDRTELVRLLEEVTPADPAARFDRDLDFLRPARFRERLHALVTG
ncbi:MAG TPA: hypothetical protein DCS55_10505 [Acidimicrobiaceae bacterium]|nr:hypothetical protein [Acidimicrobiaceae bacterium]